MWNPRGLPKAEPRVRIHLAPSKQAVAQHILRARGDKSYDTATFLPDAIVSDDPEANSSGNEKVGRQPSRILATPESTVDHRHRTRTESELILWRMQPDFDAKFL
jgi:hypothetical protein